MRSQLDVIVCLKDNAIKNKKKLHDSFFGMLDFTQFVQAFDAFTTGHGALVVDQTVQSNKISESIFHYAASMDLPSFCMVSATYLRLWDAMKYSEEQVILNRNRDNGIKMLRRNESNRKKGCVEGGITLVMENVPR